MVFRAALLRTFLWVVLAMAFNVFIYFYFGMDAALKFLAGYVIEFSLSMDNMFLFLMIFTMFGIARSNQVRVLNYGIFGAIIMRLVFILVGLTLIERFEWLLYIFGALLIVTSGRIIFGEDKPINIEKNPVLKLFRRVFPVTSDYHGENFFVRLEGVLHATPLMVVLVLIESTDLIFAIDSIPAVFAVTTDPLIVYTSNIFAILGLRSLYFLLQHAHNAFIYVKQGVGVILFFAGLKMLLAIWHIEISLWLSLGIIVGVLAVSIIASLIVGRKRPDKSPN